VVSRSEDFTSSPPPDLPPDFPPNIPPDFSPDFPSNSSEEVEVHVLGHFEALDQILKDIQPKRVLVSMPLAMADPLRSVAATLNDHGASWSYMPTSLPGGFARVSLLCPGYSGDPGDHLILLN